MLEKPGISLKRHASVDFGEDDAMHSVLVPSVSIHTRTASGSIADHLKTPISVEEPTLGKQAVSYMQGRQSHLNLTFRCLSRLIAAKQNFWK
jgi:hypothetical protein